MKAANRTDALMKEEIVTRIIRTKVESIKLRPGMWWSRVVDVFRRLLMMEVWALGPPLRDALNHVQIGLITKAMRLRTTSNKPKLDTIGLAIAHPLVPPLPRAVTMLTMTRPTTSSIMAAPTRTTPTRVLCKLAEDRIANVVPRDVEHREAPAEKAANGLG
jgi:hypothetical protein